ncbi:hypothetical protein K1T71_001951 [Dendrolimus kikuchii]|uniref:Uncharacterized protein n=1 Tax=Dendrolimus kikuchii TaxID=765133 RepID=A0ACC1DFC3_9NEOP|nr:hypothetical protein K1T71_001951 [Dendrolimus kikuchii]
MLPICKFFRIKCSGKKRGTLNIFRNLANECGSSSGDNKNKETGSGQKDECKCDPCPSAPRPSATNPSTTTMYECRKYGHLLPSNDSMPCFDPLPNVPTGVFRYTAGEVLGPGAHKCSCYPCPEYFAYQHMTFYDMHLILRAYRQPCPKTGRKP